MFLGRIAQKFMREQFLPWDASAADFDTENPFEGRLAPVDRFLSIYNRPTRMRQLFIKPGTQLPASLVFKHATTGDIYAAGEDRSDTRFNVDCGDPYVTIVMAHEVTPNGQGTTGMATHYRRSPTGPASEPGWYVKRKVADVYVDLEYRTNAAQEGVYDARVSDFYAWAPICSQVNELDTFELDGREYRVTDVYTDMGFLGMKLRQEPDPRVDLYVITSERAYNDATHQFEGVETKHPVTAIVSGQREQAVWDKLPNAIEVVIDVDAIGFAPKGGMKVEIDGIVRMVKNAYTSVGKKQYTLVCE